MSNEINRKIRELLDQKFREEPYSDCFVVDISISGNSRIEVFVDCDKGVNLSTCTQLSRYLEAWLDESQVIGEKYTLEVSSPGVDRPLIKRQYPKNVGRQIRVKTKEGNLITGLLSAADESQFTVEVNEKGKEKKEQEFSYDQIDESIIIVSF